uniref:UDP-N-acetylmuramate--L-alanine ligase n=1 Tax=Candidatus Kentrum sp. SD TaxID=2126332 RepID=A0A451BQW4_9GAMM|nr:MAG: UDP-N-acetylmuramate--L-alanine ligase [Candidatus Kentron sp. SD]VFK42765.1 MAG: UDP-N-acetylmuramate--L-alanine ligase [Candidatus Kentron sp. SD]VFK80711.1 MAG: UDP-N-acetylmuramate--L-alanine ligase [Candidatus Kentron sp. SD]
MLNFSKESMNHKWMRRIQHIHFVGVGGAGMGGIAEILHTFGYKITGSDILENTMVRHLRKLGISINIGHASRHVDGADVVVVSSAIRDKNIEVIGAYQQSIPVIPRAEMLAELMRFGYGIAVTGTHGKTTVTSLIVSILTEAGLDPTFVIGARLNRAGTHARFGQGRYIVAEADESDKSFLHLNPMMAVVTNIDADHMGTYGGDFACLQHTFLTFLRRLPFYGLVVACVDDSAIRSLISKVSRPMTTFGFSTDADFRADKIQQDGARTMFEVSRPNGKPPLMINLDLPGKHNVLNALAAIAIADELAVPDEIIRDSLARFQGVARRFQLLGEVPIGGQRVLLIDDYAHHPHEIAATIKSVRAGWPTYRLVVAFQPHRYTRTQDLFEDFVHALSEPDVLLLLDIFPAGEPPLPGITGRALYQAVRDYGRLAPIFVENPSSLTEILPNIVKNGDIVLILGAGDISSVAQKLVS